MNEHMQRRCDYFACPDLADLITDADAKVCAGHYKIHTYYRY